MKHIAILLFLLFPLLANGQALCPRSNTTLEMNQCLNHKLAVAVDELTNNLALARLKFNDNPAMLESIDASQLAWEAYRKSQCKSVFMLWQQASSQSLMTVSCSIQLARERNQFLRDTYLMPR